MGWKFGGSCIWTDFVWNRQECCHSSSKETGEMRIRDEIILTPGSHL